MNKAIVRNLLDDLCDSVLGKIDFDNNPDELFGGIITLQYIRDHNEEILTLLSNFTKTEKEITNEMG